MTVLVADGDVYTIDPAAAPPTMTRTDSAGSDGLAAATGMAYASDGTLFLVGNRIEGSRTQGIVMRGVMRGDGSGGIWTTVARTALYPRSNTNYDYTVNGITVSPDDAELYISSGSRTECCMTPWGTVLPCLPTTRWRRTRP